VSYYNYDNLTSASILIGFVHGRQVDDGSVTTEAELWSHGNWKTVNKSVVRFRKRIFAARRNKEWRKLRDLQRLFMKSEANFLSSIRHVTYNKGKNSPGLDDFVAVTPAQRISILNRLRSLIIGYDPTPSRRIYVEKPDGRQPSIGIPTVFDRVLQQVYKNALEPEWESLFESVVRSPTGLRTVVMDFVQLDLLMILLTESSFL